MATTDTPLRSALLTISLNLLAAPSLAEDKDRSPLVPADGRRFLLPSQTTP